MATDAANRKEARKHFASLLDPALTGAGNPAEAVYDHRKTDFNPKSPVVLVMSGGSDRGIRGMGTSVYANDFRLEVAIFVAETETDESWTDADRDDALDDIEKMVHDVAGDNQTVAGKWKNLKPAPGMTSPVPADVGGASYEMELIPFIAEVND